MGEESTLGKTGREYLMMARRRARKHGQIAPDAWHGALISWRDDEVQRDGHYALSGATPRPPPLAILASPTGVVKVERHKCADQLAIAGWVAWMGSVEQQPG